MLSGVTSKLTALVVSGMSFLRFGMFSLACLYIRLVRATCQLRRFGWGQKSTVQEVELAYYVWALPPLPREG